jgi:hypothetical protein
VAKELLNMKTSDEQPEAHIAAVTNTDPGFVVVAIGERLPKLNIASAIPDTRLKNIRWLGQGDMGVSRPAISTSSTTARLSNSRERTLRQKPDMAKRE